MDQTKANNIRIISGLIIAIVIIILCIINTIQGRRTGLKVISWDNYYNENNIQFFYENQKSDKIEKLNAAYKVSDFVGSESSEIEKVLKTVEILNSIVQIDDVADTNITNGADIITSLEGRKKVSLNDASIIERDLIYAAGFYSRIGTFRKKDSQFKEKEAQYNVIEYWSNEDQKWVMIDFRDLGYFSSADKKLSAVEVMNSEIKDISYLGNTSQNDYKNMIKKYLISYSLNIDNTIKKDKSNTQVTYLVDKAVPELKYNNAFAPPSIFTKKKELFEKSPFNSELQEDEKAYLLVVAVPDKDTEKNKLKVKLLLSAFKDDKIVNSFYIKVNDSDFENISKYKTIDLPKGKIKLELSLDGENVIDTVEIDNQKEDYS
ncbi:hypothetical protein [Clostridium sp. BJN0001]|uniref:hypothetical protein n=1 Tax=Clostridium sp. BJN0001 TaxID=2930219 RepID=UPI001FD32B83|nr:hypothetical protein [Clostridium sp. BJN0001]